MGRQSARALNICLLLIATCCPVLLLGTNGGVDEIPIRFRAPAVGNPKSAPRIFMPSPDGCPTPLQVEGYTPHIAVHAHVTQRIGGSRTVIVMGGVMDEGRPTPAERPE